MPVSSTMKYIRDLLDGQVAPGGAGKIEAHVNPPDPNIEAHNPQVFVWSSRGSEERQSGPRPPAPDNQIYPFVPDQTQSGFKTLNHSIDIYVTWFNDSSDPKADSSFPDVMDRIMAILRTSPVQAPTRDESTGVWTQLISLGKSMNWEYAPIRDTAGQRLQRYDATITAPVEEVIQS